MDGYRDYGPNVSENPSDAGTGGAFSGEDRSYESVIIQTDAPVIDWEMNLRNQIASDYGLRRSNQRFSTSCFLGGDFLERSGPSGSFSYLTPTAGNENRILMTSEDVLINGWHLHVDLTGSASPDVNILSFPAPPVSGTRTDLVILEVWRALIRATPNASNKSSAVGIFRYGNVKAPVATDLDDDLIDPNLAVESNARVQIQYRLRTISGINISSYIDGIDDPTVVANSVSNFTGPGADGTPTGYNYLSFSDDKGLWVAGTGDITSATALGTVDGFMFAVPVCAVMRRNSSPFNRISNMNGAALIIAGTSDRPDGLFANQIVETDVIDLRRGCSSNFEEILEKSFQQVLDNSMTTHGEVSSQGTVGTSYLFRENIGNSEHSGNPDGIRRYFSDRPITDTIVAKIEIGGTPVNTATFSLSSLTLSWDTIPINVLTRAPVGTSIIRLVSLRIYAPGSGYASDNMLDPTSPIHTTSILYDINVGPGVDEVVVTWNTNQSNITLYAELAIEYPVNSGIKRNIVEEYQLWTALVPPLPSWIDTTGWVATSDVNRNRLPSAPVTLYDGAQWWADLGHREVAIRHRTPESLVSPLAPTFAAIAAAPSVSTVYALTGTNVSQFVDTTVNFSLFVRDNPGAGFVQIDVTSGPLVNKNQIAFDLNSGFVLWSLNLIAAVVPGVIPGDLQIRITSSIGFVEIGSVAGDLSTLNLVLGFNVDGEVSGISYILIPERLTGDFIQISDGFSDPYITDNYTFNTAFTRVEINPVPIGATVNVTYVAYRAPYPLSSSSNSYNFFYRSAAMQSLLPPSGSQTLNLTPRAFGKMLNIIASGPGSADDCFPFISPGTQIPVGSTPIPDYPESRLDAPADLYLLNFDINTGFITLAVSVPYAPNAGEVTLYRGALDDVIDAEGRHFWPKSRDPLLPPKYSPAIYSQELSFGRRHKVAYPTIMELKEVFINLPGGVARKGTLVLVIFSAWIEYDVNNKIVLTPDASDSAAGVFRIRGNMMNPRRSDY
jgi:hypothetical protein